MWAKVTAVNLALNILLVLFFHYSRRMNARLEVLSPQLKKRKRSGAFSFIAGKLKLLPDERTGQRSNFFLLLYTAWITTSATKWWTNSNFFSTLLSLRGGFITFEQTQMKEGSLWLVFSGPLIAIFLSLPLLAARKNWEFYLDVLALIFLMNLAVYKLLICWPAGCCCGLPCSWGVYNHFVNAKVFPIQPFEGFTGIILTIVCAIYMLFSKFYQKGRGASLSVLFYAIPRFIWDFLHYRGDVFWVGEGKGLFGLSMAQTVCVALCILAGVWWIWLIPLEKKLMERFWLFVDRWQRKA